MDIKKFNDEFIIKFNVVLDSFSTNETVRSYMRQQFIRDFYNFVNASNMKASYESANNRAELDEIKNLDKLISAKKRRYVSLCAKHKITSHTQQKTSKNSLPSTVTLQTNSDLESDITSPNIITVLQSNSEIAVNQTLPQCTVDEMHIDQKLDGASSDGITSNIPTPQLQYTVDDTDDDLFSQ